ncbi:MAG: phosphoribosylformylglycinamidine cyclo-ligase [Thermaerobacter sp.]|nr:phosphoribosylformylglycinamidine cyclo-ligase [Thermaerobacter sp.]
MTEDRSVDPGRTCGQSPHYDQAGVHIDAGSEAVARYQRVLRSAAARPEVLEGVGGFYGAFRLPEGPTLVAGTDGVGTKVLVAAALNQWDGVGIDLVAMSVNDVLTAGAEPLFFLDYLATSALDPAWAARVVAGVDRGCLMAGCALLGGETAEMPGVYAPGVADLAGTAVGRLVADRVPAPAVAPGMAVLGIASSGFHANGFSLLRHVLQERAVSYDDPVPGGTRSWGAALLEPTRIYVQPVLSLLRALPLAAMAHITGGGLTENLPRVLGGHGVRLGPVDWPQPPEMSAFQKLAGLDAIEMGRVFNLGVGYALVVDPALEGAVRSLLAPTGWPVHRVGTVTAAPGVVWG